MESLTSDGQWIVLLGFLMSLGIITTVILSPRPFCPSPGLVSVTGNDRLIHDVRDCVSKIAGQGDSALLHDDISIIMLSQNQASVLYEVQRENGSFTFSFQNGGISYEETRKI